MCYFLDLFSWEVHLATFVRMELSFAIITNIIILLVYLCSNPRIYLYCIMFAICRIEEAPSGDEFKFQFVIDHSVSDSNC